VAYFLGRPVYAAWLYFGQRGPVALACCWCKTVTPAWSY